MSLASNAAPYHHIVRLVPTVRRDSWAWRGGVGPGDPVGVDSNSGADGQPPSQIMRSIRPAAWILQNLRLSGKQACHGLIGSSGTEVRAHGAFHGESKTVQVYKGGVDLNIEDCVSKASPTFCGPKVVPRRQGFPLKSMAAALPQTAPPGERQWLNRMSRF